MEKNRMKLCFLGIGIFLVLMTFMSEILLNILAILGILFIVGIEIFLVLRQKINIFSKIIGIVAMLFFDFSFFLFVLASEPGLIKNFKVDIAFAILVNVLSLIIVCVWGVSVEKAIEKKLYKKINLEEPNLEKEYEYMCNESYSLINSENLDLLDLCNEKVIKTISDILDLDMENYTDVKEPKDVKNLYEESEFPLYKRIRFTSSKMINVITNSKINIGLSNVIIKEDVIRHKATIFCGLFAYIDNYSNTKFEYKIIRKKVDYSNVVCDIDTDDKNLAEQLNITNEDEILKSNNEKFDKYFKIVTKEKISTEDILTSEKVEYIANFMEKYEIPFEIVVKKGKMYIRFFSNNIWRIDVNKKKISKTWFYKYYIMIKFINDFIK